MLLLFSTLLAPVFSSTPAVSFFFWGYGTDHKPLVPDSIFAKMQQNATKSPVATSIIGGCGHAVHDNGQWGFPNNTWLTGEVSKAHNAGLGFVPLIAGCTLTQLRALVLVVCLW